MVAFADRRLGVAPTRPHRTLMHDVFSLAVTLGGVALMLVSNVPGGEGRDPARNPGDGGIALRRSTMAWLGLWLLTVIM